MANSSTKHSHSKGNSLPPTRQFDFTMVDDDFEELQCSFTPKETNADTKKCVKLFKDCDNTKNNHSSSTIKMVPNDILLTDTALQLLKIVIHHGVIKLLVSGRLLPLLQNAWKTWPFDVDSRLGTNCKSATHNLHIQRFKLPAYLQCSYF